MLIRISGRVDVTGEGGDPGVAESVLQELDGAVSEDVCANYLHGDLVDLELTGGAVGLVRDPEGGGLRVVTVYTAPVRLKPAQLKRLAEQTTAQWSDGIGEGCFDALAERLGVCIDLSPLHQADDLRVEQVDDGKKIARGKTALAKAARDGDLEAVRRLLDAGADPEARLQGETALSLAVSYGQVETALELIARGADVHAESINGWDPLMTTAGSNAVGDAEAATMARALLETGADPHRERGKPGWGGHYTPLYLAENRKKKVLAKVLREFGATE